MSALNSKQQAFIEYYLTCWNASAAARRAGYSEKTAPSQGQRLLKNVEVSRAIEQRMGELKMSSNEALLILTEHARGSLNDFINENDQIDLDRARAAGKMHLVKKYKTTKRTIKDMTEETVEIELHDPQAAAVHIGKHHGAFVDRSAVENSGTVNQNVKLDLSGATDEQLKLLVASLPN
jgi:phage terminase small subunit